MFFIRRNRLLLFTIAALFGLYFLWNPIYLILTCIGYLLILIGGEIGMHRYYAHRSFECNKVVKIFLWICIFISGLSEPVGYARQHRYHHKHSDKPTDIHPVLENPWKAWFKNRWVDFSDINISDLTNNKFNMFMFHHYFTLYFMFLALMFAVNVDVAFYLFVLPTALVLNVNSAGTVLCHKYGYRNFNTPDNSRNNLFVNILTLGGVGLHNNHHANPRAYSLKVKPYEFDLVGLFIKYFLKK